MAFIETPRLLDRVRLGYSAGPEFDTQVVLLDNGKEQRNQNRVNPRRRFTVPFTNITPTQYSALLAAFFTAAGRANGFRFKDWLDYTATSEALGNTPGANLTPVQLKKTYTNGAYSYVRTITKPVSATVYSNGVAKAGTLDTVTGLFTPTTNWAAGEALTWTGEFDVPVRFENDFLPATWDNYQVRTVDVELVELL